MENIYMSRGASKVVNVCAKIQPGEQVLIITELSRMSIAQALATEVYRVGAEPAICIMEPRKQDSEEPPKEIAAAMKASDAFLSVVGKSITHTHAVKEAIAAGSRGLVLTHFTEEMMIHGGIEADFEEAKRVCMAMAQGMAGAEKIVLTSPSGTHLEYSAKGRRGNHLYCMVEPGQFSTLPTVEANVSPLEGTANGVIVADGSIPYIGIGVLDALPIFGTGTVLIPWALLELLTGDWKQAVILTGLYLVCYFVRQILEVRMMGGQVGLSPLETLASVYVGLELFGFFGFILGPLGLLLIEDLVEVWTRETHD